MDDLEFRRRLLSDPHDRSDEILQKILDDQQNRQYVEGLLNLDSKIEQAFHVDVPDDLADKIIFAHSPAKKQVNMSSRMFALAASLIFAIGLGVGQINWGNVLVSPAHASLENMAMHHIEHGEQFISGINEGNSEQEVNAKLSVYSYRLSSDFPYHIYYLNHCGFSATQHALHMVFAGQHGRVTAFVTKIHSDKKIDFTQQGMKGQIIPLEKGSLVLIGSKQENIDALSQTITPLLTFTQ
ncbi:DUF3379 family protein [Vibrio algicola]|uniref:DUF3379 family protein n=1 Tax=Vibrio algicola TaxID=2662262 RepID=A0A5Q0TBT2_9VIBR|nr:DUF3379 family protein [Vibrio algicola]